MICNFSKNTAANNISSANNASSNNSRSIYINRTQSDNVPVENNLSKSMGTSFIMSLRARASE